MKIFADIRVLNCEQRATFAASVLGWTLDAFDYFILVFLLRTIAADFKTEVVNVSMAITLTLIFRPLGALVFGWLAERYGRRPILMINVLLFSFFELATAFAPNLLTFLIIRSLFGFAMGGEWGLGASLVMESIPAQSRGAVSGILQQGYPLGYLLASVVFLIFFPHVGWRGMFIIGVVPAVLVFYIRSFVKESPVWAAHKQKLKSESVFIALARHWKAFLYVTLLMTAFNFFSHGTQDMYPTFLQGKPPLSHDVISTIAIVMNIGAIIGGITMGIYSQRVGRRRAIIIAALLALPIVPLWAFSATPFYLGMGAFFLQMAVQGAWGVIPAHLNELSPEELRSTFPGFAYQLGNLLASSCAILQPIIAAHYKDERGDNYGIALALVVTLAALAIVVITALGKEARETTFGATT